MTRALCRGLQRTALAIAPCLLLSGLHADAREPITDYRIGCMGCHLEDGSGAPNKVPSMRESLAQLAATADGRRYLVQVPGVSRSLYSDEEVARLLNWMVRNLSAQFSPERFVEFTRAEVAAYRAGDLVNVAARRAELLSKIAAQPKRSELVNDEGMLR